MRALLVLFVLALSATMLEVHAEPLHLHFVTESFRPFTYAEAGKAAGPFVDIVQSVCAGIKAQCTFEVLPWRRALKMMDSGEADGIFSILGAPERRAEFYLSAPIIQSSYSLYAEDSNKFSYKSAKDLAGKTIGVYGPSGTSITLGDLLAHVAGTKVVTETNNSNALRVLSIGGYGPNGLVLANSEVARSIMQSENLKNLREAAMVTTIQYCIGFSKKPGNIDLFKRFDSELRKQIDSGATKAMLDKYGMKPARTN